MNTQQFTSRGKKGASFPLQLMFHLSRPCSVVWTCITFSMLLYKGTVLPFPIAALPCELISVVLVCVLQFTSSSFGVRGNLTESPFLLLVALLLLLVGSFGVAYFCFLQTYVMRMDLGVSAAMLGVNGLTLLFGVVGVQNVTGDDMKKLQRQDVKK